MKTFNENDDVIKEVQKLSATFEGNLVFAGNFALLIYNLDRGIFKNAHDFEELPKEEELFCSELDLYDLQLMYGGVLYNTTTKKYELTPLHLGLGLNICTSNYQNIYEYSHTCNGVRLADIAHILLIFSSKLGKHNDTKRVSQIADGIIISCLLKEDGVNYNHSILNGRDINIIANAISSILTSKHIETFSQKHNIASDDVKNKLHLVIDELNAQAKRTSPTCSKSVNKNKLLTDIFEVNNKVLQIHKDADYFLFINNKNNEIKTLIPPVSRKIIQPLQLELYFQRKGVFKKPIEIDFFDNKTKKLLSSLPKTEIQKIVRKANITFPFFSAPKIHLFMNDKNSCNYIVKNFNGGAQRCYIVSTKHMKHDNFAMRILEFLAFYFKDYVAHETVAHFGYLVVKL